MEQFWHILDGYSAGGDLDIWSAAISFLLAFVLGQALAWIYYFTHISLSYSKTFVQSLIIMTIIVSLVMRTIAGSFVIAVGLMGALSLIRFRNVIKDTRDITFLFCSLVIGMACGSGRYALAITGSIGLYLVLLYLYVADFGMSHPGNAMLHFTSMDPLDDTHPALSILTQFCRGFTLVSSNSGGLGENQIHYSYQLSLRNSAKNEKLLAAIRQLKGVQNVSLTMQEQLLEM